LSAAAATGFFRLKYKNSLSDPPAAAPSAANLAIAFNALKDAVRDQVTATFSAAISAGTTATVTYSVNYNYAGELLQVVDSSLQTSAPAAISATTTRTTAGNGGFTTGTYSIYIYAWKMREIASLAGEVSVRDV